MVYITKQVIITLTDLKLRVCNNYKKERAGRFTRIKIKMVKADANNSLSMQIHFKLS